MTVFAPSHELTELDPTKRVRYSLGMIVGDDELRQDQRYLTARDDRHQRALHGWGVVSGLELVSRTAATSRSIPAPPSTAPAGGSAST